MADYDPLGGPFSLVHARFTHAEAAYDFAALTARREADPAYDDTACARGLRAFVLRGLDEQRSLAAFSALLSELCEARAPVDVIGAMTRVVRDEARHVDLCRQVVDALGGWPERAPEAKWVRSDPRLPLTQRIARGIVGSMCVGETISVAMLEGVRRNATDPTVRAVLTQMLADESFHSRFGWWWLAHTNLDETTRADLRRFVPRVLAQVRKTAGPSEKALAKERAEGFVAGPFGMLAPSERKVALHDVLTRRILPGLTRAGLIDEGAPMEAA